MSESGTPTTVDAATPQRRRTYSTRTLMVCAALAAVFAVLFGGYTLYEAAILPIAPLAIAFTSGMWFALPLLAMLYLRRLGVAIITAALGGLLVCIVNPFGPQLLLFAVAYAVIVEIPFAITRWRRFGIGITLAVSAVMSVLGLGMYWSSFSGSGLAPVIQIALMALLVVVFLGWGLLALGLARALRRLMPTA